MEVKIINTFDYSIIKSTGCQKRPKGNQGTKHNKRKYKDLFCAFDIETTNDLSINQAYMYIWQCQIEDQTVIGRTWEEWLTFLERIGALLAEDEYIMLYVHNLSFEFTFLKGIYSFEPEEVFAIDRRKVLKCEMMNHFEFRCSYLLTNMSLSAFTHKMGVTEKLSGEEFNYKVIRYPWTELSPKELEYCVTDVKALVEALKVYFSIEHDNFYTISYTSTGFVRRDVKRAMRRYNRHELESMQPDYEVFQILREAFRGGNTHCNRYYTGMILENVSSYDRVSSYPDVQINELFPMSKWIKEENPTVERITRIIYKQHRACIMRVGFIGLRLKNPLWGCPYIPKHKCRNLRNYFNDNGRILSGDLEISLTDIDLKIILDEYLFDEMVVYDFYHCRYGKLPKPLREEVQKYFQLKTELKGVSGSELYYQLSKAKLNSVYGMSVTNPCRVSIDYINDEFIEREEDEEELLKESNRKAFLVYAWGIFTTAFARAELEKMMNIVGVENFVYCDTDSVKFIDNGSVSFDKYNKSRKRDSIKNGGVGIDRNGKQYYLGVCDYEGTYKKFVSLGAKKYAYVANDDSLHITVAGVGKSIGAVELAERGGIESFKEGFIFYKAGGTESVYNDNPEIKRLTVGEHSLNITSNVLIKDSTYTLGITGEYKKILENPAIWLDYFK